MKMKKNRNSLYDQVDDQVSIVHDFRRRTKIIFESYRALNYKKTVDYNLDKSIQDDTAVVQNLIKKGAVDMANDDVLLERIAGTVFDEMCELNKQRLEHLDFYNRQSNRAIADSSDIQNLIDYWKGKKQQVISEHEKTLTLFEKYSNRKEKSSYETK